MSFAVKAGTEVPSILERVNAMVSLRPARWMTATAAAVLVVAGFLAYSNSFSVPLIFDDRVTIAENPHLGAIGTWWAALTPPDHSGVGGRPVSNLSFVLNHAISGNSLRGYHAGNLLIHLLAALALYGITRRTLARFSRLPHSRAVALVVALLWLVHPLQTQSVTYLSQRTEALMGLFYLTALYGFVRATKSPQRRWKVLTVASCALGMAAKEGMVTAPLTLFLYDYTFVAGSITGAWQQRKKLYLALGATWGLLVMLLTTLPTREVGFGFGMTAWNYALVQGEAVARYVWLALWPQRLTFDYGIELGATGVGRIIAGSVVGLVLALTIAGLRRKAVWGFLGGWFFLTLAPTSSVVPIPFQPISENRAYLALAAIITCLALAVKGTTGVRCALPAAAGLLALGGLTFARNTDYRSEIAIWSDTVAKQAGSARAHHNLGCALVEANRLAEARAAFETALRLNPRRADTHANLASVYGLLGLHDRAIAEARTALQLGSNLAKTHYTLGVALTHCGRLAEAIEPLRAAVRLEPAYADAHTWLARVFLRLNRPADAAAAAAAALQVTARLPTARFLLATALLALNRPHEAVAAFEALLRTDPLYPDAHYALGTALLGDGRAAEAVPCFREALRLKPRDANAHGNLGVALWQSGHPDEAGASFEAALRIDPTLAGARENLAKLRATRPSR